MRRKKKANQTQTTEMRTREENVFKKAYRLYTMFYTQNKIKNSGGREVRQRRRYSDAIFDIIQRVQFIVVYEFFFSCRTCMNRTKAESSE